MNICGKNELMTIVDKLIEKNEEQKNEINDLNNKLIEKEMIIKW